jgi:hypothetical protein
MRIRIDRTRVKEAIFRAIAGCTSWHGRHPILLAVLRTLFVGGPALILSYAMINLAKDLPYQKELRAVLASRPIWVVVLVCWTLLSNTTIQILGGLLSSFRDRNFLKTYDLLALLRSVDRVVGLKLERFGDYCRNMPSVVAASRVFYDITQPEKQIDYLVKNLYTLLVSLTKDDTLKLVLARMENDTPIRWQSFMPDDVHPDDAILNGKQKKSLFSHCARRKEPLVIPDIGAHLKGKPATYQYLPSDLPGENQGSIVCYPLRHDHTGKVVFALSLKSDRVNFIGHNFERKYTPIVKEFIKRINLEHSLELIKARAR